MTKLEFILTIAPLVQAENKRRGNPLFNSVVIAQAICETGWGQSAMMMKANAIFGIKAGRSWKGKVYNAKTKECYNNYYVTINALFRAYDSLQESISDYFNLICNKSRYKKALYCNNYTECITAIKKGGYATSPTYVKTITDIIKQNNLTKYDNNLVIVENAIYYKTNKTYTLQFDLKVRTGAGINYRQKRRNELTKDGKKNAYNQTMAVLKKGTKVTCKKVKFNGNDIWLKIPSGYVAGYFKNQTYIK